jgi:hypothetical protein
MSFNYTLNDLGPDLVLELTSDDDSFVLNASTDTAVLRYKTPEGDTLEVSLVISSAATGEVTRRWEDGDLPVAGAYVGQVEISRGTDATFPRTFPNDGTKIIWWVNPKI